MSCFRPIADGVGLFIAASSLSDAESPILFIASPFSAVMMLLNYGKCVFYSNLQHLVVRKYKMHE
jgi:hypothetical protein